MHLCDYTLWTGVSGRLEIIAKLTEDKVEEMTQESQGDQTGNWKIKHKNTKQQNKQGNISHEKKRQILTKAKIMTVKLYFIHNGTQ